MFNLASPVAVATASLADSELSLATIILLKILLFIPISLSSFHSLIIRVKFIYICFLCNEKLKTIFSEQIFISQGSIKIKGPKGTNEWMKMYREITGNRLEAVKNSIEICNMIIDMQTTEIVDIMLMQEDSVVTEGESSEPTVYIDADTIIPQLEKLNHNLGVLKDSRTHLLGKLDELKVEQEKESEE